MTPLRILVVRSALGWSQARAARYCRVHRTTFERWERGAMVPHPRHVRRLEAMERLRERDQLAKAVGRLVAVHCPDQSDPAPPVLYVHKKHNGQPLQAGEYVLLENPNESAPAVSLGLSPAADGAAPGPGPAGPGPGTGV